MDRELQAANEAALAAKDELFTVRLLRQNRCLRVFELLTTTPMRFTGEAARRECLEPITVIAKRICCPQHKIAPNGGRVARRAQNHGRHT